MTRTYDIWRASFTRRWHRHAYLCDTHDPVGAHQGRVMLLVLALEPTASRNLLIAAATHDIGEAAVGDVPNPVKNRNPDLKAALDRIEAAAVQAMGLPIPRLNADETKMLRLCDKLDAVMRANHHHDRRLMSQPGWQADIRECREIAKQLGLAFEVEKLMEGLSL